MTFPATAAPAGGGKEMRFTNNLCIQNDGARVTVCADQLCGFLRQLLFQSLGVRQVIVLSVICGVRGVPGKCNLLYRLVCRCWG